MKKKLNNMEENIQGTNTGDEVTLNSGIYPEIFKPIVGEWIIETDCENNIIGHVDIKLTPLMGLSLLHPLRRIMLGFSSSYGVVAIKVTNNNESPLHIFASITGVLEDMPYIHANIKKIKLKITKINEEIQDLNYLFLTLSSDKPGTVYAKDILIDPINGYEIEIINPNQEICNLDIGSDFKIEMLFRKGMGYASEEMNQKYLSKYLLSSLREGWFYVGTQFSSGVISFIGNVVEMTGGTVAYDLLKITIKTDGRIDPETAFYNSFEILHEQIPFYFEKKNNCVNNSNNDELSNEKYNVSLKTLGLQPGTVNQLERNGIYTLKDLLQHNPISLKLLRGFGNTRLADVITVLSNLGHEFKN